MKTAIKFYSAIWATTLALFNVITFVTPHEIDGQSKFTPLFFVAYGLITLFFIAQLVITIMATRANKLTLLFYNISLVQVSFVALGVMLVVGGICMAFPHMLLWVGVIACFVALAVNIVAYAKVAIPVAIISEVDEKVKRQTNYIRMLSADADALASSARGKAYESEVKQVYEAIRYSDPMSIPELEALEEKIANQFELFKNAVKTGESDNVYSLKEGLLSLIAERNAKVKALK